MTESDQPGRLIGAKAATALPITAETPWGPASVVQRVAGRDALWAFGTRHRECPTRFGKCAASFELRGLPDQSYPTTMTLTLDGGSDNRLRLMSEAAPWKGTRVAWKASVPIDPLAGRPVPGARINIVLYEGKPDTFGRQEEVAGNGFETALLTEIETLIEGWATAHAGYAAVVYAALSRRRQLEREITVDRLRGEFLAAADERDQAANMARAARNFGETGRGQFYETKAGVREALPFIELRGFSGECGFDDGNLDEILVHAPASLHMETMSDTGTWMGVYLGDGRRLSVRFNVVKGKLVVGAEIDDEGVD